MSANQFRNWLRTLGAPEDPVATDTTSPWSMVSLVKALFLKISDGSFAGAVTGRAESFVSLCQAAASQCAQYLKMTRAAKIAAAASQSAAAASAAAASIDATISQLAAQGASFLSGMALLGQRVRKDRVAAAASATAAAASAASITSESIVLGVQVYS